jgi:hypothetical protein
MVPDWKSLAKLDHALWPTNLHYMHGCWWVDGYDGSVAHDQVSESVASELCAMRAVRWLTAQSIVRIDPLPRPTVMTPMDEYGDNWYRWSADTLDAALYAATKAVLDARGKK